MHMRVVSVISAFALSAGCLIFAGPAAAENVLRFASLSGGAVTIDPHSRDTTGNNIATKQVYEPLLDIDSNLTIVPQLALSWKPLNPTTWEFILRPNVRFQDGAPFTAGDVVFSFERARAGTSTFTDYLEHVAAVEVIDGLTIHIATTVPDPLTWMRISHVLIMSKAWAEAHDVRVPAGLDTGEETYASRHANGTAPFIVEEFEPHGLWVMVRN
jgi:peptide/nickel transport system substrate-binding protein